MTQRCYEGKDGLTPEPIADIVNRFQQVYLVGDMVTIVAYQTAGITVKISNLVSFFLFVFLICGKLRDILQRISCNDHSPPPSLFRSPPTQQTEKRLIRDLSTPFLISICFASTTSATRQPTTPLLFHLIEMHMP
jgi:hypothetical protein